MKAPSSTIHNPIQAFPFILNTYLPFSQITETLEEAGQHLDELHEFGVDTGRVDKSADNIGLDQTQGDGEGGVFENKAGHHTHVDHVEKV